MAAELPAELALGQTMEVWWTHPVDDMRQLWAWVEPSTGANFMFTVERLRRSPNLMAVWDTVRVHGVLFLEDDTLLLILPPRTRTQVWVRPVRVQPI